MGPQVGLGAKSNSESIVDPTASSPVPRIRGFSMCAVDSKRIASLVDMERALSLMWPKKNRPFISPLGGCGRGVPFGRGAVQPAAVRIHPLV